MAYWLMKSEPDEFSIKDLQRMGKARWDGVRNYQVRNFMRLPMREGCRSLNLSNTVAVAVYEAWRRMNTFR